MRSWNRIEKSLFVAFLIWSAAGLIFTFFRISSATVDHWPIPGWLARFVQLCLDNGDPILILLAFANTHLHAARQWSAPRARRWGLIILIGSLLVETLGASTGFPFGSYSYTDRFGRMIGVVPITIPLAWYVVVTNSLFVVRTFTSPGSRLTEAGWVGLFCTIYDFVLEPFATTVRHYWIWSGGIIPLQNYASWFALSGLFAWLFAPDIANHPRFRDSRPIVILVAMVFIFAAGRWAYAG